jgi:DNA-binding NtrC family response regulator
MVQRILVVDDDPLALKLAARLLRPLGVPVETAGSAEQALAALERAPVGLLLTDLRMDGMDGEALLDEVRRRHPQLPVLIMTSHGTIDVAVALMKKGATDFIAKPLEESTLLPRIERLLREADLEGEVVTLRRALAAQGRTTLVGETPAFKRLLDRLPLAARADAPVLVRGETGTGKELVARTLHALSARQERAFVPVNCGALPGELLESELFGHVRGAFTDARRDKPGLVLEADGGTLFLDEIGDMALPLQVKLLRFLQEGEIRPVGANKTVKVDVRVVAATHRDLAQAVAEGAFREDLYYRLNVVPLWVPPLRERRGDLPALANHILERIAGRTSRPDLRFSKAALERLQRHDWPGNVRELENVVHRAVVFAAGPEIAEGDIELDALPEGVPVMEVPPVDLAVPLREAKERLVEDFERAYVEAALTAAGGNVAQAARRAGKDRKSFWELMQRYGVDADAWRH